MFEASPTLPRRVWPREGGGLSEQNVIAARARIHRQNYGEELFEPATSNIKCVLFFFTFAPTKFCDQCCLATVCCRIRTSALKFEVLLLRSSEPGQLVYKFLLRISQLEQRQGDQLGSGGITFFFHGDARVGVNARFGLRQCCGNCDTEFVA